MLNNHSDLSNINLYISNSKNKINHQKNNNLNKNHPTKNGPKNINITSYRINTAKNNSQIPSKHLKHIPYPNRSLTCSNYNTQNNNLDKMTNTLKININDRDNNTDYYINKELSKKNTRNDSSNTTKNIFYPSDKNKAISLNVNKDNKLRYIYNSITNEYDNKNNKFNYSYNKHRKNSPNKKNLNSKLSEISNRYNNYVINKEDEITINRILTSIKPMFRTAQNFYRNPKKKNSNKKNNNSAHTTRPFKNKKNFNAKKTKLNSKLNNLHLITTSNNIQNNSSCRENLNLIYNNKNLNFTGTINIQHNRKITDKTIKNEIINIIDKNNFLTEVTNSNDMIPNILKNAHSIKKEIDILKEENKQLKLKLFLSNNTIKNNKYLFQKEQQSKESQILNLKNEIQKSKDIITKINSNDDKNLLLNSLNNLQEEISNIKYNLNYIATDEYLTLKSRNIELIKENKELKEKLKNLVNKNIEEEIIIKDNKIYELIRDLENKKNENKDLEERVKTITCYYGSKLSKHLIMNNKYVNENKSLKEKNCELSNIIESLTSNESEYKKIIDNLKTQLKNETKNQKLIVELNKKIETLENTNNELLAKNNLQLNSNSEKEKIYKNEILQLKEEIQEKTNVINDLYKQINDFKIEENKSINNEENEECEENEILNQQIEELQRKLKNSDNEKEKLELQCSDLNEEINKLNELINMKQEDNKLLKNTIKQLQQENELLKKQK